jgi:hypothetical protein
MHLTWPGVSARRLARNHLVAPSPGDPARVAADLLGVHAQVMSAAEVSIGIRCADVTRTAVRDALWTARTLVKSRGPRGTVHLLAAEDLPIWTGAMSALPAGPDGWPEPDTERVLAAMADAVAGAELTVDELTDALVARIGPWVGERVLEAFGDKWPRWRAIEGLATHRGVLCFGPDRGRRTTYTSPRRWLPGFVPAPAEPALTALVERFLHAYGPATPAQFARWLGAPPGWATRLFARQTGIEEVDFDGTPAFVVAGDTGPGADTGGVRLLPYFDVYLIACFPRHRLFPGPAAGRALSAGQAGTVPAVLIDGEVGGVWHQRRSGATIRVPVEPLIRLTAARRRAVEAEADRVGRILEGGAATTFGTVTVGPHA